jgi:hypothetical protein
MRYHCLNTLNKTSKDVSMENESIKFIAEKNQSIFLDKENSTQDKIDFINDILNQMGDSRIKKIFNLRYFSDSKINSWYKIGKKMKISTQTAINIHNKAISFLNKKMSSNFLFDKIWKNSKTIIIDCASSIPAQIKLINKIVIQHFISFYFHFFFSFIIIFFFSQKLLI